VTVTPVAFVAVTVNMEECPVTMVVGFAAIVTVGAGLAVTVTIVVAVVVPPGPVAVAVYVVVAVGVTVCVPPVARNVYELPSLPEMVTVAAFTAVTVSVDELPGAMEGGTAVSVTVGAGLADTVTIACAVVLPPAPLAVAVYVVV
jgi:hypothetical protein